jgi:ABC-type polar amino acid transport system ATPase subunit
MVELNVPRPPPIKTKSVLKKEAEQEALKGLEKFNLKDEYDLSTYQGRFKQ